MPSANLQEFSHVAASTNPFYVPLTQNKRLIGVGIYRDNHAASAPIAIIQLDLAITATNVAASVNTNAFVCPLGSVIAPVDKNFYIPMNIPIRENGLFLEVRGQYVTGEKIKGCVIYD